jgi:hypothetical protein
VGVFYEAFRKRCGRVFEASTKKYGVLSKCSGKTCGCVPGKKRKVHAESMEYMLKGFSVCQQYESVCQQHEVYAQKVVESVP